jgi:hypothetical protein
MKKLVVERGQRFQQIDVATGIWLVEDVFADAYGRPHARLVLDGDDRTKKTLCCERLADPHVFVLLNPPAEEPSRLGLFRRRRVA